MDAELKASRISIVSHLLVAVIAGWLSLQMPRALYGIIIGIIILLITGFVSEKIVKKKGVKWWAGNGLIIYLFFWFVSWVLFFNIM